MRCGRGIFKEAGLSTTSFGISASGVLVGIGGVLANGRGGNPGGKPPGNELSVGVGVFEAGAPGSMPAARSLSSKEFGSTTGVDAEDGVGGC